MSLHEGRNRPLEVVVAMSKVVETKEPTVVVVKGGFNLNGVSLKLVGEFGEKFKELNRRWNAIRVEHFNMIQE